jgi:hypothetical protein
MRYNCGGCRHYSNGYCRHRKIKVEADEGCDYFELPYEIPLPPDGRKRLTAVSAKKHVTLFTKNKRGATDPELKELRKKLNLPPGFRLEKSGSHYEPLIGSVHIKNAVTNEIIRTLSAEEVIKILMQ